jgi:hypothetical protein
MTTINLPFAIIICIQTVSLHYTIKILLFKGNNIHLPILAPDQHDDECRGESTCWRYIRCMIHVDQFTPVRSQ